MEKMIEPELEKTAREMRFCLACSRPKDEGLVVCWDCFKNRKDVTPFKYWEGDLVSWISEINRKAKGGFNAIERQKS